MKFILSETFSGLGLGLFLYVVLILVAMSGSSYVFWFVCLVCAVGVVALTYLASTRGQDIDQPISYFGIAVAAMLAMGCLAVSPHLKNTSGFDLLFACIAILGVPLGVGGMRLMIDRWRPLSAKAFVIGSLAGIIGVTASLWVLFRVSKYGFVPFVPITDIAAYNLFGFDIFPWAQSGTVIRKTLLREPLGGLSLSGAFFTIALIFQGAQSTLVALWDTLLAAVGVLATTWAATRLFLGRS